MGEAVRIRFASDETGWAEHLGEDRFRIKNIPLAGDLNIDDVVICEEDGSGWLQILEVVERTFPLKTAIRYEEADQYVALCKKIESLGGKVEGMIGPKEGKPGFCVAAHDESLDLRAIVDEIGIKSPQFDEEDDDEYGEEDEYQYTP